MHPRRAKLMNLIAMQAAALPLKGAQQITELRLFPVREPVSGRAYTVVRLRTSSGISGFGECYRVTAGEEEKARRAILGRTATAYAVTSTGTSLDGAITTAMIDILARTAEVPAYRLLGGPTRTKVRALTSIAGASDEDLLSSLLSAHKAGYRAFQIPLPITGVRNQGQAFATAVQARMSNLRAKAPPGSEFVLHGGGQLTPADAATVAASLERFHLLWFDEPCASANLRGIHKISDECVTPIGFGKNLDNASIFQDLLRDGLTDVVRPTLQTAGIAGIRQIAAMAETYYTAVAPNHEGGPVGTAASIHLAASLPNFFIQHIPLPASKADQQMRRDISGGAVEEVQDGFLTLPKGAGFGVEIAEEVLIRYKDGIA